MAHFGKIQLRAKGVNPPPLFDVATKLHDFTFRRTPPPPPRVRHRYSPSAFIVTKACVSQLLRVILDILLECQSDSGG